MLPCGFCFVEYATRKEAGLAVDLLNHAMVDGRMIRVDWDYGYEPQRQFGRGKEGGQVRDEMKTDKSADTDRVYERRDTSNNHYGGNQRYDNRRGTSHNYEGRHSNSHHQQYPRKRAYRDRDSGDDEAA